MDFKEQNLRAIATWAHTARQFYDNHNMTADEFEGRINLKKIEFLLSVIIEARALGEKEPSR